MGISQLITGCLSICKMAINNHSSTMMGLPPFPIVRDDISLAPKKSTTAIKTENRGRLLNESPAYIIANKEGIPRKFINTLEDFFVTIFIFEIKKRNLQGLHYFYQKD